MANTIRNKITKNDLTKRELNQYVTKTNPRSQAGAQAATATKKSNAAASVTPSRKTVQMYERALNNAPSKAEKARLNQEAYQRAAAKASQNDAIEKARRMAAKRGR